MADIICLAETNLNWPILQYNSRLNNRLRAFYREFYSTTSINRHENTLNVKEGERVLLQLVKQHTELNKVETMLLVWAGGHGSN